MDRRSFLKTAASAGALTTIGGLAAPAIAQSVKVLKFVPEANLANFDPIWASTYLVRNAAQLVWDTLYCVDSTLTPSR
jgi:peptide/nickel transport system substrate-binding protein